MPPEWRSVGAHDGTGDDTIVAPGGSWREFRIYSAELDEEPDPDIAKYLRKTCNLLETLLPGAVSMAKLGVGEIIFSALAPGTKLIPHCASNNVRLTCHLGMVCPDGARIRVGPTWGSWQEGKCTFFDDSFEHEIVHDGDRMRVVLLIRFWHPELPMERWIATLEEGMETFERLGAKRMTPPENPAVSQLLAELG